MSQRTEGSKLNKILGLVLLELKNFTGWINGAC